MSMFHDQPLLFAGIAPPALEKKPAALRMSFMSAKGAPLMSGALVVSASASGPLFSIATPLLTSSTWPSSSAVIAATRL